MRGRSKVGGSLALLSVFLVFVGFLGGCPNGGHNTAPTANAGPDQSVILGSRVALNGNESRDPEGAQLTFRWSFIATPPGSMAILSDPTSRTSTFTTDVVGVYEIRLVVDDGKVDSAPDTITISVTCDGNELFNNAEWVVARQDSFIPEDPFDVIVDGNICGRTKLLTFASRVTDTNQFPQVLVINSSGFLRIKAGADPTPPIPFGQSLVLGPAILGMSASFPNPTLFFNPQIQTVSVDTSQLNPDGTGNLLIALIANDTNLPMESTRTNQIMNLTWDITLHEPTNAMTQIDVTGQFTLTEDVIPDPVRTAEFESFRLFQISSLFIDDQRHDVDALRYRDATGLVQLFYTPDLAGLLLPQNPTALDPETLIFESLHTDDGGEPNGNTPSYRMDAIQTQGPVTGPFVPRVFFIPTDDVNDDNLGVWLHQDPAQPILPAGTTGRIEYSVVATTDPLPAP